MVRWAGGLPRTPRLLWVDVFVFPQEGRRQTTVTTALDPVRLFATEAKWRLPGVGRCTGAGARGTPLLTSQFTERQTYRREGKERGG